MSRSRDLEARLNEWGKEYGGGRYDNIGWQGASPIVTLMTYHGRAPQGLNPARVETNGSADEVEAAVRALQSQRSGRVLADVLRCEYYVRDIERQDRLRKLSRIGHRMETSRYSHHLRSAKIHVAGWLRIPFDEPLDDAGSLAMLEHLVATTG